MATCLPEEIIFYEILSRFSVKFLIRLSLVCKRWFSLIIKPGPINSHLVHTSSNLHDSTAVSIIVHTSDCNVYPSYDISILHNNDSVFYNIKDSVSKICDLIFRIDPSLVDVESNLRANLPVRVELIDSVNGLVCFSHNHAERVLFIWNPVTNFFRTVFKPSISGHRILNDNTALFYDTVKGDLKIMRIELLFSEKRKRSIRVHLYSCNAECWREIKDEKLPVSLFDTKMRGVKSRPNYAYVLFYSDVDMLVAFDFYEEVFKKLPCIPFFWGPYNRNIGSCINWMDSLCMVGGDSRKRVIYTLDETRGTWYKKYDVPGSLKRYELEVCLSNGDIVFQDSNKNLFLLEAQNNKIKTIVNLKDGGRFDVIPYTKSLLFIKGMQELNRKKVQEDESMKRTQTKQKRRRI